MTDKNRENVYQFLAGYWYDREEDDISILNEFLEENSQQIVAKYISSTRQFLDSPDSLQTKSDFVRKAVWRYFPEDVGAPLEWLNKVLSLLEELTRQKGNGG